jgi:lipid-A-disaccharide synthase
MDETIVTELIQGDMNTQRVKKELDLIIHDKSAIEKMQNRYAALKEKLGTSGASAKGAKLIHLTFNL